MGSAGKRYIRKSKSTWTVPVTLLATLLASLGSVALWSPSLIAGDVMPQGRLDASGTGTVPVATPLKPGFSKFTIQAESFPGMDSVPAGPGRDYAELDRINRFDVLGGVSVLKGLDLHLGIHGSYERLATVSSRRISSGSALLKVNMIRSSGFNLALAPYIESGIGRKGEGVYTRAVKPSGGLMMLAGYALKNRWEWHLAIGNRNRASEEFDNFSLGHEFVYKTAAKFHLSNQFGLTVAADGRQLRIHESGRADEHIVGAGRGQLGVFYKFSNFEANFFGGASIDRAIGREAWKSVKGIADFDGGPLFYGMSLSMSLGQNDQKFREHYRDSTPDIDSNNSYEDVPTSLNDRGQKKEQPSQEAPVTSKPDDYNNDFLSDFSQRGSGVAKDDDFSDAEARIKQQQVIQPGAYDISAVEQEIERLREAELKAEESRRRAEEARIERERQINARNAAKRAEEMRRMRDAVRDEVDALPTITTEDMSWHGLE